LEIGSGIYLNHSHFAEIELGVKKFRWLGDCKTVFETSFEMVRVGLEGLAMEVVVNR
jgi:hypothetical protein